MDLFRSERIRLTIGATERTSFQPAGCHVMRSKSRICQVTLSRGASFIVCAAMAMTWTCSAFTQRSMAAQGLVTLADSVADFSNTQGYRGWQYGYVDTATGPGFAPFSIFQSNYPDSNPNGSPAWVVDTLPADSYLFTALWASGGMDNGLQSSFISREQYDDRRWVSNINTTVTISGQFGNPGAPLSQQDGISAFILVNGTPVWSFDSGGYIPVAPYFILDYPFRRFHRGFCRRTTCE